MDAVRDMARPLGLEWSFRQHAVEGFGDLVGPDPDESRNADWKWRLHLRGNLDQDQDGWVSAAWSQLSIEPQLLRQPSRAHSAGDDDDRIGVDEVLLQVTEDPIRPRSGIAQRERHLPNEAAA